MPQPGLKQFRYVHSDNKKWIHSWTTDVMGSTSEVCCVCHCTLEHSFCFAKCHFSILPNKHVNVNATGKVLKLVVSTSKLGHTISALFAANTIAFDNHRPRWSAWSLWHCSRTISARTVLICICWLQAATANWRNKYQHTCMKTQWQLAPPPLNKTLHHLLQQKFNEHMESFTT